MSHDWSALTVNTGQLKMCLLAPGSLVIIGGRFYQLSQNELFFLNTSGIAVCPGIY